MNKNLLQTLVGLLVLTMGFMVYSDYLVRKELRTLSAVPGVMGSPARHLVHQGGPARTPASHPKQSLATMAPIPATH